jgi:hypothetical protein
MVTELLDFAPSPPPASVLDSKFMPYVITASGIFAALTPREIKDDFYATRDKVQAEWSQHQAQKTDARKPEGPRPEQTRHE